MLYIATFPTFLIALTILTVLAICFDLAFGYRKGARWAFSGAIGSFAGYAIAPLMGALIGLVPKVMVEPQYFFTRYYGCIAPDILPIALLIPFAGSLLGFVAGLYFSK